MPSIIRNSLASETYVLGLADVRAKMLSLPKKVGTLIVRRGLLEGAGVIRDDARERAPVRLGKGGGRLKKAVISQTRGVFRDGSGIPVEHRAVVLIKKPTDGKRSVRAYAHFVEFGTAPHHVGRGSLLKARGNKEANQHGLLHPGAKPQPFLGPAFESKKFEALRVITERIRSEIYAAVANGGQISQARKAG